ncbi:hypothetical protein ACFUIY_14595 [Streptomyces griseorubiginosus]|uniref:hypothetical protein n=1 Tax=Streptomyces griseorubiginosus TaxID=67304 RepID=UPI003632CD3A
MSSDPRTLQQRVHAILRTATVMLDLPLGTQHVQRLAVEVTPAVRALLAEALDGAAAEVPVRYAVIADSADLAARIVDTENGVETTEYAGCVSRIGLDIDLDSPAAVLAGQLRQQNDVIATDVPTGTYLGLTIRPRTVQAWQWWLRKLAINRDAVTVQGGDVYAVGERDGVAVHLRGADVARLLPLSTGTRAGLDDVDFDTPAGTFATAMRRQPDVTAIEIRDAHHVAVTVRATSLVEWQWWLTQLGADPSAVTFDGAAALVTGAKGGASVELRGEACRAFYEADEATARLMGLITETSPARS